MFHILPLRQIQLWVFVVAILSLSLSLQAFTGPAGADYKISEKTKQKNQANGMATPVATPDPPVLLNPANLSTGNPTGVQLSVQVSDPNLNPLNVTFYARRKLSESDAFVIVGLPDTQYYTGEIYGGSRDIFYSQTQWVIDNLTGENIVFVSQLGDCTENGDDDEDEWKFADTAMSVLENPATTALDDGIPFAIAVGNHDQIPWGDPNGTTTFFNAYFGESRFNGRLYYGGHYGTQNDNSFQLFSAGGMDFIVIHLEYDPAANSAVLTWAGNLLQTYSNRRAIIVSHYLIAPGNPGNWGAQGAAIYNQVKDNANVFLMLGGHYPGEGQRSDTYNGNTIHTLLSNYQNRTAGGNGWLRIMKFNPADNEISVKTYSPWLETYETDTDSEFTLNYNMDDAGFEEVGSLSGIESGEVASVSWDGLLANTPYEWYVTVDDGTDVIESQHWDFTTGNHRLDLKVFLEGPYTVAGMTTELHGVFPLTQPFNAAPWNYTGDETLDAIPAGATDWVLVELRDADAPASATTESIVLRKAAILKSDGSVEAVNGELIDFPINSSHNLYPLIIHQNHLNILAALPAQQTEGIFYYDFTTGADKSFGGASAQNQFVSGAWGMVAGDSNGDGTIDDLDKAAWQLNAGNTGYFQQDHNMDSEVDNSDKNDTWLQNLGRSSQIPE